MSDVKKKWEIFMIRKVLFMGRLTWDIDQEFHPRLGNVRPIDELTNSLLFVDLISVLDSGLDQRMDKKGIARENNLSRKIDALDKAGEIIDNQKLHDLRKRRNSIAHDLERISSVDLEEAIRTVEDQLLKWDQIESLEPMVPFTETDKEWSEITSKDSRIFYRKGSFGIQKAKTAEKILSYNFEEQTDDINSKNRTLTIVAGPR